MKADPNIASSPTRYKVEGIPITITAEMINKALKTTRNGRASGPEGIPIELLKYGHTKLKYIVANLFSRYIQ